MRAIFVPGIGRGGAAAWPQQAGAAWADDAPDRVFLSHEDLGDEPSEQAAALMGSLRGDPAHLVAHSAGAVPALLVAARSPESVRSIVLLEPACFGSARGGPEVEQHVADMSPVFTLADDPTVGDGDVAARFLLALGAPQPVPGDPAAEAMGRRLRAGGPPWRHGTAPDVVRRVPTLVVTGGWSALYEEVAAALTGAGARHLVLRGHDHRPQDHRDANEAMAAHWTGTSRTARTHLP